MSDLVRQSVDLLLQEQQRLTVVERALNSVGKFHSGKHDISVNHDDYLADAYADFDS